MKKIVFLTGTRKNLTSLSPLLKERRGQALNVYLSFGVTYQLLKTLLIVLPSLASKGFE
jgi:hypothetical protein